MYYQKTNCSRDELLAFLEKNRPNAHHAAIGTDFDGGFGVEKVPMELNTIADLPQLDPLLKKRGYNQEDIARILHGNWYKILQDNLPTS